MSLSGGCRGLVDRRRLGCEPEVTGVSGLDAGTGMQSSNWSKSEGVTSTDLQRMWLMCRLHMRPSVNSTLKVRGPCILTIVPGNQVGPLEKLRMNTGSPI